MCRLESWIAFILVFASVERAHADFVFTSDPTTFAANDVAPWIGNPTPGSSGGGPYPTNNGLGIFSFGFSTNSVPFNQSLGTTSARTLFLGVTSSPILGNQQFSGGIASYSAIARLDQGPYPVLGFGFIVLRNSPESHLRVFDVRGNSQEFLLRGQPFSSFGFVGITSDVPISRFQFSQSVVDSTAVLHVAEVQLNIAVPAPPSFLVLLTGVLVLAGSSIRREGFGFARQVARNCGSRWAFRRTDEECV